MLYQTIHKITNDKGNMYIDECLKHFYYLSNHRCQQLTALFMLLKNIKTATQNT